MHRTLISVLLGTALFAATPVLAQKDDAPPSAPEAPATPVEQSGATELPPEFDGATPIAFRPWTRTNRLSEGSVETAIVDAWMAERGSDRDNPQYTTYQWSVVLYELNGDMTAEAFLSYRLRDSSCDQHGVGCDMFAFRQREPGVWTEILGGFTASDLYVLTATGAENYPEIGVVARDIEGAVMRTEIWYPREVSGSVQYYGRP